ncbi:MAG TPA: GtrA family protein [Clostridia bacterium]|nr:GtrA family protein [Clostridia bacterium]
MKNKSVNDNAQNKFTAKHAELWKFIKFSIAGFSSTIVEVIVHYILQNAVFSSIRTSPLPESWLFALLNLSEGKGYLFSYIISTTIGYTIAFILNRKITFKADINPLKSIIMYVIMVIFTIFATAWLGTQFSLLFTSHGLQTLGDIIVKPLVATLATVWTYPINRFIIHKKKKTV